MGRGALAKVRWKNDRIRKKKARDKRLAAAGGRSAPAPTPAASAAPAREEQATAGVESSS